MTSEVDIFPYTCNDPVQCPKFLETVMILSIIFLNAILLSDLIGILLYFILFFRNKLYHLHFYYGNETFFIARLNMID